MTEEFIESVLFNAFLSERFLFNVAPAAGAGNRWLQWCIFLPDDSNWILPTALFTAHVEVVCGDVIMRDVVQKWSAIGSPRTNQSIKANDNFFLKTPLYSRVLWLWPNPFVSGTNRNLCVQENLSGAGYSDPDSWRRINASGLAFSREQGVWVPRQAVSKVVSQIAPYSPPPQ